MKILVDELPTNVLDCPFTEFDTHTNHTHCFLNPGCICNLVFGQKCSKLTSLGEFIRRITNEVEV